MKLLYSLSVSLVLLIISTPLIAQEATVGNTRSERLNEEGAEAVRNRDFIRAEQLFRLALDEDGKNLTAAYNLAGMLLTNKKEAEAISLLEKYTKEVPDDVGLWVRLGDGYLGLKKVDNATSAYERAYGLDPKYPELGSKLATVYSLKNRLADAERVLRAVVEANPQDAQALSNLAAVLLGIGKADDAIRFAKRSLQVKVTSDVYVTLGTAYELKGDAKNALISFQRAIDLGDKREELKTKVAELKRAPSDRVKEVPPADAA